MQTTQYGSQPPIAAGSRVIVVVSSGPFLTAPRSFIKMPLVTGMNQGKALSALQDAGLQANVFNDYSADQRRGVVIGQLPPAEASVPAGSEAVVLVSSGEAPSEPKLVPLPDVVGHSEADAVSMLQSAGLSPQVVREYSTSVPVGTVISQLPNRASLAGAAPPRKSGWLLWAGIALAVLLVVLGAFWLFGRSQSVVVPDVVGMAQADAVDALEEAGLSATTVEAPDGTKGDEGEVVSQDPAAGIEISKGDAVSITVIGAAKLVEVPDVVGQNQSDATRVLEAAGFTVATQREDSISVDKGLVIRQSPAAGDEAEPNSDVQIVISSGAPEQNVKIPDVVGMTSKDAQKALEDAGLDVVVAESSSDDVDEGYVISQIPDGGDSVAPGTSVGILVSTGKPEASGEVKVPDVVGMTLADAQQVISDAGLKAVPVPSSDSDRPANEVVAQTPEPDTEVEEGGSVVLFYSTGGS